jgi:hypothetical protein
MPKIIVTAESGPEQPPRVLFEESVQPVHLSTPHAAGQLIERLAWALGDADERERSYSASSALA